MRARWPSAAPECPPTSLVGRDADLAELRRLTRDPATPFVTLTGIGGVGKSRLAAELAAQDLGLWHGRVAFVPLDGVSDASLVLPAIAGAIGVTDEPGRPLHEALTEALTDELGRAPPSSSSTPPSTSVPPPRRSPTSRHGRPASASS